MKNHTRWTRILATVFVTAALLAFAAPASAAPGGDLASGPGWSIEGLYDWFQSMLVGVGILDAPNVDAPETIEGKARVNLDPNGDAATEEEEPAGTVEPGTEGSSG